MSATVVMAVGDKIRHLRKQRSMSQTDLAERVGTTPNTISRWETGVYSPSLSDLEKLALILDVGVAQFFPDAKFKGKKALLLNAVEGLPDSDLEELIRYAHFRRATTGIQQLEDNA